MPVTKYLCGYCGHRWTQWVINTDSVEEARCAICGETKMIALWKSRNVYGYDETIEKKSDPLDLNSYSGSGYDYGDSD